MATCFLSVNKRPTTAASTIPTDIVTDEILPKLPAKSLVRYKCVSKSFNTLISYPEFIDIHLHQSRSSDANRLFILVGEDDFNLYAFDSTDPPPAVKIPLPRNLEQRTYGAVSIIGSVNGLLCVELASAIDVKDCKPVLINPCTGEYREVPDTILFNPSNYMWVSFGFGYDDIDYKVVRIVEWARKDSFINGDEIIYRHVMVFNFKGNQWKMVQNQIRPTNSVKGNQNGVLMNNYLLHWLFWGPHQHESRYRICCFDVRSENWVKEVPLMDLFTSPNEANSHDEYVHELGVIDDCLCLSTSTGSYKVIVWIMKEYGLKESWVKLFEIPLSCLSLSCCFFYDPSNFRQGSKLREALVRSMGEDNSGLYWCDCDIGSHTFGKTEIIKGVPNFRSSCFFKGSLVLIPGGQHINAASSID